MVDDPVRCAWARNDPAYLAYHDQEWGVPLHDDRRLFESLVLQGAQAGLSWLTILKKRDHYRLAFEDFDPAVVAEFDASRIKDLMKNPGLVRNRRKIESARGNARAFLEVQEEIGSFDRFIWSFVDYRPIQNRWPTLREIPARTETSERMSRELKKRGFRFVGPTICYALMQAAGLVNDHTTDCFRHAQLAARVMKKS